MPARNLTYRPTAVRSLFTAHSTRAAHHSFSAKERDAETGLSYFGARYYSSDLSIWLSVDPMSGKYPSLSPYVYCADNPVKLVDPNGEEIDPESQPLWDAMRTILTFEKKMAQAYMQIETQTKGRLCCGATSKYLSIDKTLSTMDVMESKDNPQIYKLSKTSNNVSKVFFDSQDQSIVVNFYNTAGFIHEITHCAQFERNDIGFGTNGRAISDIYDELEAYTNQLSYSPQSTPGPLVLKPLSQVWLLNVYDGKEFPYRDCGLYPIGANSTAEDMNVAYPPGGFSFDGPLSTQLYFKQRK